MEAVMTFSWKHNGVHKMLSCRMAQTASLHFGWVWHGGQKSATFYPASPYAVTIQYAASLDNWRDTKQQVTLSLDQTLFGINSCHHCKRPGFFLSGPLHSCLTSLITFAQDNWLHICRCIYGSSEEPRIRKASIYLGKNLATRVECCYPLWALKTIKQTPITNRKGASIVPVCAYRTSDYALMCGYPKSTGRMNPHNTFPFCLNERVLNLKQSKYQVLFRKKKRQKTNTKIELQPTEQYQARNTC